MNTSPPADKVLLTLKISPDLRSRLKAHCALQGKSMSEVLIQLINLYLKFSD